MCPVSRQSPAARAAADMTRISAWAVGSASCFATIVIGCNLVSVLVDQHRPDRNLALVEGQPGLVEGETHPPFVFAVDRNGAWS